MHEPCVAEFWAVFFVQGGARVAPQAQIPSKPPGPGCLWQEGPQLSPVPGSLQGARGTFPPASRGSELLQAVH